MVREFFTREGAELRYNFHAGQARAWRSTKRVVAVVAGAQSGKTTFGPAWLLREIQACGPGDYLVATPTYTLLERAALPALLRLFRTLLKLGEYNAAQRVFVISEQASKRLFGRRHDPLTPTRVIFGYADNPESLEAMTVKAAWLDEAGQKAFKQGSWESIRYRRTARWQGRILITTTPYAVRGWLAELIASAQRGDPYVDVIRFDSTENPAFPREEFEEARRKLPRWKFDLFYRGVLTRPAGLIYDVFDRDVHAVPRFAIPKAWPRYIGLDFGGVNTAAVFLAQAPDGRLYAYREYLEGGRTAAEHAEQLLGPEPVHPTLVVGGSKSEGQWRAEFRAGGLAVRPPDQHEVEVGIDRVYATIKRGALFVFDDLQGLLDEFGSYSRVLDERGEPTEDIDDKSSYHRLDAVRYIVGYLERKARLKTASVDLYAPPTALAPPRQAERSDEEVQAMLAALEGGDEGEAL